MGSKVTGSKLEFLSKSVTFCCRMSVISCSNNDLSQHHTSPVSNLSESHLKIETVSPPLLVEEAGERLAADLFGEVIFPPQHAVFVLLVVPLTGRDVRTLRDTKQININTADSQHELIRVVLKCTSSFRVFSTT